MAKKDTKTTKTKTKKSAVKKPKVSGKKTAEKKVEKTAKPLRKKLGKGLEDISTLFLSAGRKVIKKAKKKTEPKKVAVKKVEEKKDIQPKTSAVKKTAVKKPAVAKKKITKKTSVKKPVEKKVEKKAFEQKPLKKQSAPKKTTAEAVKKAAKNVKKKFAAKKTTKTSKKKIEVVQMDEIKKSSKASSKPAKKTKVNRAQNVKQGKQAESDKKKILGPISQLKNLYKKQSEKNTEIVHDNFPTEQIIEDSKFYISQTPSSRLSDDDVYELPAGYGDNRIVIQVRDPYWVFAYWEISQRKINDVQQKYGHDLADSRKVLRVYDITGISFNGNNANSFFDIDINDMAKNWYINVGNPGRSYCVDIGFLLATGKFVLLARSNFVTTPIDGPSHITDEEWMIVEDDFNKLYGLSAGLGIGLSSGELRKQIKSRMQNLSSGILSSPAVTTVTPQRNFWLVVNAELIVYGATQPGADVSVQGQPIKLNKDGTFSLRFALPDGEQVIPVKAVSPDKVEERQITPIVTRKTV
jgi:hypothetical protein